MTRVNKELVDLPQRAEHSGSLQPEGQLSNSRSEPVLILIVIAGAFLLITVGFARYHAVKTTHQSNLVEPARVKLEHVQTPVPTSRPSLTANWKTFTTPGLSFKYPSSWSSPTTTLLSTKFEVNIHNILTIDDGFYYDQALQRGLTFQEFIDRDLHIGKGSPQDFPLGNLHGKRLVFKNSVGKTEVLIALAESNSSSRIITLTYEQPGDPVIAEVIGNILSTFQIAD